MTHYVCLSIVSVSKTSKTVRDYDTIHTSSVYERLRGLAEIDKENTFWIINGFRTNDWRLQNFNYLLEKHLVSHCSF